MNGPFSLFQAHVANRLGVSEERVRELRAALVEGEHWIKRGHRLLFSAAAVERLAGVLGAPVIPRRIHLLAWPERHRLVVTRLWHNPRFVGGVLEIAKNGAGFAPVPTDIQPLLRIKVKTSAQLARGMVLECVHLGGDLYEATQLPRRKGRW